MAEPLHYGLIARLAWNSEGWTGLTDDRTDYESFSGLRNESWNFAFDHPRNEGDWIHGYFHESSGGLPQQEFDIVFFVSRPPDLNQLTFVGLYANVQSHRTYQPFEREYEEDAEVREKYPGENPGWNIRAPRDWVVKLPTRKPVVYNPHRHSEDKVFGMTNYIYTPQTRMLNIMQDLMARYSDSKTSSQLKKVRQWLEES